MPTLIFNLTRFSHLGDKPVDMSVRVTFPGLHREGQHTPNMGGTIHRMGLGPDKETPSWAAASSPSAFCRGCNVTSHLTL